jgi:NAD(P)-dependent dehydrogenase (short-subunit alcohol dehydrogenase family)
LPDKRFSGKTAWVTGADTAVGEAVAIALHEEGARLLLSGTSNPPNGLAGDAIAYPYNPVDKMKAGAALEMVDRLHIVVAGTRFIERSSIAGGSAGLFDRVIEENLIAAWCALHAAAGKMGKGNPGPMLVLSSIHGEKPTGSAPLFSIANGGLNMLMREAAQDLGRLGFRVNMLRYGPLEGDERFFASELSGLYHDVPDRVPRGRAASPWEIAQAALLLLDDGASFVNGAILTADGGFLGHYVPGDSDRRWENGFGTSAGGASHG